MSKRTDPLDSLLARIDELDDASRANLITRFARERRLMNTIVGTLREGVIVVESSGRIQYANPSSIEILGLADRDVHHANLWRTVPDLARTLKLSGKGHLQEVSHVTREIELTYPARRYIRLYIVPIEEFEDEVRIDRYAVILSDISADRERNQQEIADERVNSILELAAGVAHELGNPLNSLTIHLQLMRRQLAKLEDHPSLDRLERSLQVCAGEVERLDSIVTHFLGAVRPRQLDLQDLDLIVPLEESLEFLRPELESAGLRVDIELDTALPVVMADRDQIKQVFFNIIKNARQAMKAKGTIRIRAFSDDEFVYIQIGDTGEGISKDDLQRVFQPYFTTKKDGHGLGMMIVDRIMREHGGQIGIDSREGVGTLVTLHFPQKHRRVRMLSDH